MHWSYDLLQRYQVSYLRITFEGRRLIESHTGSLQLSWLSSVYDLRSSQTGNWLKVVVSQIDKQSLFVSTLVIASYLFISHRKSAVFR